MLTTTKYLMIICLFIISSEPLYSMQKEENDKSNVAIKKQAPKGNKSNSDNNKKPEENAVDDYAHYLTKNSFVSGATVASAFFFENWYVGETAKIIEGTTKHPNWFVNLTVGSALRGWNIKGSLPVARRDGKIMGIVLAGMAAPIIWDCGREGLRSCHKVGGFIFKDNVPSNQTPTKRDYLKAVLTFGTIGYLIYKYETFMTEIWKSFATS